MATKRKTLYSKAVMIFLIVLLLSFIFSGTMLYLLLDEYLIQSSIESLKSTAEQISIMSNNLKGPSPYSKFIYDFEYNIQYRTVMEEYINSIYRSSGTYVFIVDNEGQITASQPIINPNVSQKLNDKVNTGTLPDEIEAQLYTNKGYYYFNDKRQYESVLYDDDGIIIDLNDYYGLFKDTNQSWITIAKRLSYKTPQGEIETYGSIVICSPDQEIYKVRSEVIQYFVFSVGFAIVFAFILVVFYTSKITRPLKLLEESAAKVAKGNFQERVTITSNDEIGALIESFNTMVNELDSIDKVRSDFIANVSHDLRTPMTTVRGFLEGILDGTVPEDKKRYYLEIVRDEVIRMNSLVNNLLEMTKLEQGKIIIKMQNMNINEMLRKCLVKCEQMITGKNIDVEVLFENEDEFVSADPESIERVILNLLHNAVKFTGQNGVITVGTNRVKNKVEVFIKDTGIGIPEDELKYIWDRFYKTDKSRGIDKTGAGLGLSICKNIINAHKQDIYVESTLGEGSKFVFTLDAV